MPLMSTPASSNADARPMLARDADGIFWMARYVSGLLHPDETDLGRYRGYTQTHAWSELYFPSYGWIGFDPTNSCVAGENYVKVAVGRDYRDVPPNKGLYRGAAKESINVEVKTAVLPSMPNDLFPEKIVPMGVATSNTAALPFPRFEGFQQEQSQQQQQQQQQTADRRDHQRMPFRKR